MIAVFLAEGFEETEALFPVDIWRRAGLTVKTVSIAERSVTGSHRITVTADARLSETDLSGATVFFLPGGQPGTDHLANCPALGRALCMAADEGKLMTAICAAPGVLGQLGLLVGRSYTCYPGCQKEDFHGTYTGCGVETDTNGVYPLVTGAGPGQAAAFAFAVLRQLGLGKQADLLQTSMQF